MERRVRGAGSAVGGAVVGVDVGTTSTKAGVYDLRGRALGAATVSTTLHRDLRSVYQRPDELLRSTHAAIREAMASAGMASRDVLSVGVSGQMAGVMGIGGDGEAVTPYDSWLDVRCAAQLDALAADHGARLLARTGCPPMVDHAPKMQWWRDQHPRVYARIARFVMPAAYVAGRLAGLTAADAFIDPSYLHFTGVADARRGTWSPELIDALGLDAAKLPRIVGGDELVGTLTADAARACGLRAGTPVAAGMGDTAAGALGAGLALPGELLDTAGTAAVLAGPIGAFPDEPDAALIVMRGALPGQWTALNYVAGGGLCLPWLAAQLATDPVWPGEARPGALETLLSEAADAPAGADGLVFVPHLEGRIAPHEPRLRGGFAGLGAAHGRGHLARAVMEGVAFEYALYLEAMRRLDPGAGSDVVRAIGGGARSDVWNAIKADALGLPVRRVAVEETATRGVAIVAGAAAGALDAGAVAADVVLADPIEPDPRRHDAYVEALETYRRTLDAFCRLASDENRSERPVLA